MSTTVQSLILLSNNSIDQPTSPDGHRWKSALTSLLAYPSWFSLVWGRHLESKDHITIIIDWKSSSAAQTFFTTEYYVSFAALLAPLLATTPEIPHITDIHPSIFEPTLLKGSGLTTITRLRYSSLSDYDRLHLLPPTFSIYEQEICAAAREAEEDDSVPAAGYKGGSASWERDRETGERTASLWMMMSWESVEAEQRCEKELMTHNGLNMKEAFLGKMLEKADTKEIWHVKWEMLTMDIMKFWKDSKITSVWPHQP